MRIARLIALFCIAVQTVAFAATNAPEPRTVRGLAFIKFGPAEFMMGCPTNVSSEWKDHITEYPSKNAILGVFWFGRIPVTVEQYCEFLNAKGFQTFYANEQKMFKVIEQQGSRYQPRKNFAKHAIGGVTFRGAIAYCRWFSEVTGLTCRLPTSAEWEFVAKGKENRIYPWGNRTTRDFPFRAVPGTRTDLATPEGVFDLIGPVYQWCSDIAPRRVGKLGSPPRLRYITRGGTIFRTGFINEKLHIPPNWRWTATEPNDADSNVGFRVVLE